MNRVLIALGGTGGHVYPAMALAEQLIETEKELIFVGGGLLKNRYFNRDLFTFHSVACGSFVKKNPFVLLKNLWGIGRGIYESLLIIKDFKPDLVVGFGSYHSFPPLVAAKLAGVPFILYAADSIPGKVIRLLSRFALTTGIHFPQAAAFLKGKAVEVGLPLRKNYKNSENTRHMAIEYFQLNPEKQTVLVFGGSQGAQAINRLFSEAMVEINQRGALQVLHFTGEASSADKLREHYHQKNISACVKGFEHRMDLAWQIADIVISRAGASTIAEQLEFEVPGILIPYPQAADNHQELNADYLVKTIGGGIKLIEKNLSLAVMTEAIEKILTYKLQMQNAIRGYKKRKQNCSLIELVEKGLRGSI